MVLVEIIHLNGSRDFLQSPFPLVEAIPFSGSRFLTLKAIPFSGEHSL